MVRSFVSFGVFASFRILLVEIVMCARSNKTSRKKTAEFCPKFVANKCDKTNGNDCMQSLDSKRARYGIDSSNKIKDYSRLSRNFFHFSSENPIRVKAVVCAKTRNIHWVAFVLNHASAIHMHIRILRFQFT